MTGNPVGLVEFLLARLDEMEAAARRVDLAPDTGVYQERQPDGRYTMVSPAVAEFYVMRVRRSGIDGMPEDKQDGPATNLFHLVDRSYVLQDIAAKQKLIAYWSLAFTNPADVQFAGPDWDKVRRAGERTLRLLAAPFSSHPDWQPEWSVE